MNYMPIYTCINEPNIKLYVEHIQLSYDFAEYT